MELMNPRTSSYSNPDGNCLRAGQVVFEPGAFRKSSKCEKDCCVEVGAAPGLVGVQDSKLAVSPTLVFSAPSWRSFTAQVRAGDDIYGD